MTIFIVLAEHGFYDVTRVVRAFKEEALAKDFVESMTLKNKKDYETLQNSEGFFEPLKNHLDPEMSEYEVTSYRYVKIDLC